MVAAHAARALCPRCNRSVRTGVELHAAAADLEDLLRHLEPLRVSVTADDHGLHSAMTRLVHHYTLELHAELAGEHLNCDATGLDQAALDFALARADACAARERATA